MTLIDSIIFFAYFFGVVIFALTVAARSKTKSSSDFFLASRKLPWYAVGASFIASNISTEHFIGMVGWGYLYGMAVAHWEWGNFVTFSILIWVFLPFYMRGNITTMPEFLERRFNKTCRYIYAIVMIVGLVIAMLGGVLFAGAKAINVFFPNTPVIWSIVLLAGASGIYTIYGGLLSAVWADVLQYTLLMTGGIVVTIFGLYHVGGIHQLTAELPEKFILFYPADHEMIPWTGLVLGVFSVGIWYSCANQFMVQRCLGARSEWDARMGIVMAGFSKALLPLIVVVPGVVAFHLFQNNISDGDQSWPFLVQQFLPTGLIGLVLAGLASAIMSTLSAITNSSATIFTLDLYGPILRPNATDKELHRVGRISGAAVMLIGVMVAILLAYAKGVTVFGLIQQVFYYIAPPIAAVFLIGILWPRATPVAGTVTLIVGFTVFLPAVVFLIFPRVQFLAPYDNFMHHTFAVFVLSVVLLVVVSLLTPPRPKEELQGVIWNKSALGILEHEKAHSRGFRSLTFWWALMCGVIVSLYVYTHSLTGHSTLLEAENLNYTVSSPARARLQVRQELEAFNLWTGRGQILFMPRQGGDTLRLDLPVKEPGRYRLSAIVTMGPDYGEFRAEVNGKVAKISYPVTRVSASGSGYEVVHKEVQVFDGKKLQGLSRGEEVRESIAGEYVVHRITLGDFDLRQGRNHLSFVAVDVEDAGSFIGIDQLILRPLKGP